MSSPTPGPTAVTYIGGPTAIIEIGGVRLLIDPTFDPPGEYPIGARSLTKTQGPALEIDGLERVDAVLLTHDQHPDNLDRLGRDYVLAAPCVLSTRAAMERLGTSVTGLAPWESAVVEAPDGRRLDIRAVPALHGPPGSEHLVGDVTGFILSAAGGPRVYVSGDNASVDVARDIGVRGGPFDGIVLFAGAARTALADGAPLTLTSEDAATVVDILGRPPTVMLHFEGWAHFSEGREPLRHALERAGLADRVTVPDPGETVEL